MRILVVGGGGREHVLCWAIGGSPLCDKLYCAPGNAGIAQEAECVAIGADDVDGLVAFAKANAIDLVDVGPEGPLVLGLVDRLEAENIRAFGPRANAAMLEGSKGFMKDLCAATGLLQLPMAGSPTRNQPKPIFANKARPSWSRRTGWQRARASPWRRPSTKRSPPWTLP